MAQGLFDDFSPLQSISNSQNAVNAGKITRGSLISFSYPVSQSLTPNIIHDPRPMVIVADIWPTYIRGVNLHYLTFPYVKKILQSFGGNQGFNYTLIRNDKFIANAFRMYAVRGVKQPKKLDMEWLLNLLAAVRSFNPGEIEKIQANIQQQIQARLQAKANEMTSYEQWRSNLSRSQQTKLQNQITQTQQFVTNNMNPTNMGIEPRPISPMQKNIEPATGQPEQMPNLE